jgi:O-methyltransferase involved in polyketide biosynthesis
MLDVMVGEPARNGVNRFTPEQVGQLFTFLARQMARKRQITVDTRMFDAVQEYLMNPEDPAQREEREQAVLELLNVGKMQLFSDPDRLLKLSEDVKFYRVSQLV